MPDHLTSGFISDLSNPASISGAFDAGTAADRVMLIFCISGSASNHDHADVPTYDGVAAQQLEKRGFHSSDGGTTGPSLRMMSVWKIDNPASGSNDLIWGIIDGSTTVAQASIVVLVVELAGSTDVIDFAFVDTQDSTAPSVTATPGADDSLLYGLIASNIFNADPYTPGSGMTEIRDSSDDGDPTNHNYWVGTKTGSGAQTLAATQSNASSWGMFFVEVTAVATGRIIGRSVDIDFPTHTVTIESGV